jgi:hypothetical protein
MTRDTRIQLGAVLALMACLTSSVALATGLAALQGREKLVQTDRAEEGQSWEVSAGIAMGAFRGIFVNFLWIRANEMKEAGKYFEAIELASAITRLQPKFPRVWVFHAWNMSYNISVMTHTDEERWNWVNAGIRLLRDKAIPANPNDVLLHKELGWIFLHKIGGYTDDANAYYKRRLAMEWTVVLGPPPGYTPADRDVEHRKKIVSDWLGVLVSAPGNLDECYLREPTAKDLVSRIDALGYRLDIDLLDRFELHKASRTSTLREVYQTAMRRARKSENTPSRMEQLTELVDDATMAKAWAVVVPFIRAGILRETYRMEPERMIRYVNKYGPMDFRHHAAHALYWSARGVDEGFPRITKDNRRDIDTLNTDRVTVQAVQDLFRSGEMYFDFFAMAMDVRTGTRSDEGRPYAILQTVPSAYFVRTYGDIIDGEVRDRSWTDQLDNRGYSPLTGGYENFLKDAICFFFRRGEIQTAELWYARLRTYGGLNLNNPQRAEEMSAPIDEFVLRELNDRATSPNVAQAQIAGALQGAFTSGLLAGDLDLFTSQFEFAKRFHKYFMEQQRKSVVVNQQYVRMDQVEPDFRLLTGVIFTSWVQTVGVDDARQVYFRAPEDLKRFAYDFLVASYKEYLDQLAAASGGEPFSKVFPEPPDMPGFRSWLQASLKERGAGAIKAEQK